MIFLGYIIFCATIFTAYIGIADWIARKAEQLDNEEPQQ